MRVVLFIFLTFISTTVFSQGIDNENVKAQMELEKKGYFGHFDYKLDEVHSINVNYSITPKVPSNTVFFSLHTPEDRPLNIVITNTQGKKLVDANFTRNEYIKEGTFDLSKLKAGKYIYLIQWEGKEAFEIPFEKK